MSPRARLFAVAIAVVVGIAPPATAQQRGNPAAHAWTRVYEVLSHPRCANCHVNSDNLPMWSGRSYGVSPRPHGMNVSGGTSRNGAELGLPCSTCHTRQNSTLPHGPPGAPSWALAPLPMQWFGKSSAEICAQLKDRNRNGNRSLEEIAHHIEDDPLVLWGWDPGPGRTPAPYSGTETARSVRVWAAGGAPCPTAVLR